MEYLARTTWGCEKNVFIFQSVTSTHYEYDDTEILFYVSSPPQATNVSLVVAILVAGVVFERLKEHAVTTRRERLVPTWYNTSCYHRGLRMMHYQQNL